MAALYFLGVDIGTYESKACLTDRQGRLVASKSLGHLLQSPKPGYAEHNAETDWWGGFVRLTRAMLQDSGIRPNTIKGIGVSGIAPCCLPVDRSLQPLRNAILYGVDVRSADQVGQIEMSLGKEYLLERYGSPLTTQAVGPKIRWLQENEPQIYQGTHQFHTCSSYLVAKLTGNFVVDHYTAATYLPLYNPARQDWEDTGLESYCRRDQLPQCIWTTEVAGHVHTKAARETGLAEGTPVLAGTADASAEAVSAGVLSAGDLMLMFGSSAFMIQVSPVPASDHRIWAGPYLFPGTCMLSGGMSTAGTLTRWLRDNFAREFVEMEKNGGPNAYDRLMQEAADVPPGSEGLLALPYFSGERTPINDPLARGAFLGLNLTHQRKHIYNALLESVGYGVAAHVDIFSGLGAGTSRIMAVGGGTKNPHWMQIIADICQKELLIPAVDQGACYGDALLAALGTGHLQDAAALSKLISYDRVVRPNKSHAELYRQMRSLYESFYLATKDLTHQLQF